MRRETHAAIRILGGTLLGELIQRKLERRVRHTKVRTIFTGGRERVPEKAATEGEEAAAHGDFLAVAAPGSAVARAAGAAGGDAEWDGFEAHAVLSKTDIEPVVGHDGERGSEGVVFGEEAVAVERALVMDEVARERIHMRTEFVDAIVVVGDFAGGDAGFGLLHLVDGLTEGHVADEAVVDPEDEQPIGGAPTEETVEAVVVRLWRQGSEARRFPCLCAGQRKSRVSCAW